MKKVLIIDDDNICNFINRKTLQSTGRVKVIDTAVNGQDALSRFEGNAEPALPDLILLDLNMPVMDGFEFLTAFSKLSFLQKEKVKIVVLTSSENAEDIQRAKAMGASGYLSKPLNLFAALEMLDDQEQVRHHPAID